ncbi:hypothetical protein GOODEAATRI_013295 [Goodea atripinnis]|uniref:Uncharacterized protein n=1 Tax=Goodea atripinnis TaxID=208336 RepID=A0ABV0P3T0_9TELE
METPTLGQNVCSSRLAQTADCEPQTGRCDVIRSSRDVWTASLLKFSQKTYELQPPASNHITFPSRLIFFFFFSFLAPLPPLSPPSSIPSCSPSPSNLAPFPVPYGAPPCRRASGCCSSSCPCRRPAQHAFQGLRDCRPDFLAPAPLFAWLLHASCPAMD